MDKYDVIVIGGGPGGYLCAERSAEAGMKVLLLEERAVGGTCLNEGCIPSKTFLNSAKLYRHATESKQFGVVAENVTYDHAKVVKRKNKVVKTLVGGVAATLDMKGVKTVYATAKITGAENGIYTVTDANGEVYQTEKLVIATGSEAVVPPIPGAKEGLASGFVMTNREILDLTELPKTLVVIGGGVIGLEMACYFASVGTKVIVVEMMSKIAGPTDAEMCDVLGAAYGKRGMEFLLETKVLGVTETGVLVEKDGQQSEIPCDRVLLSAGRRARTAEVGVDVLGLEMNRANIVTDEHMLTNVPNVYAIGDCNGKIMLAHTAYREAEVAVNHMIGKEDAMDYGKIPSVIYTDPEVASVGMTKAQAEANGLKVKEVKLPMVYAGRYVAETEKGQGFCKFVIEKGTKKILGIHMIGSYTSEMILSAEMMMDEKYSLDDLKKIIFPHPTVGEIMRETIFQIR